MRNLAPRMIKVYRTLSAALMGQPLPFLSRPASCYAQEAHRTTWFSQGQPAWCKRLSRCILESPVGLRPVPRLPLPIILLR